MSPSTLPQLSHTPQKMATNTLDTYNAPVIYHGAQGGDGLEPEKEGGSTSGRKNTERDKRQHR